VIEFIVKREKKEGHSLNNKLKIKYFR
jgi:hypothetical protein